jgi:Antibiotic biosynthesis monooxygenase
VFGVVNRLTFTDPVDDAVAARFADAVERLDGVEGLVGAHVVRTGEREVHLVLLFTDADAAARVTAEIGNPMMREHIVPLLAGPTDRRTGDVIATTGG